MTAIGLTVVLALAALAAQPSVFHAETRLVVVQMSVHDRRGAPVTNLDRNAVRVYENGKLQPIALFLGDNVPVSLGLVIDNSGSMRGRRGIVEEAAVTFARSSNPLDELFVVNFADAPRLDVAMTSDLRALENGIGRADSIGGTALRDAVDLAERYMQTHAKRDRRALLIISDGHDNSSTTKIDQIRRQAEQGNIALYAIGLPHRDPGASGRARRELDDLTERTGGLAVHAATMTEVTDAALGIAHRIRQQYTLAYAPLNQRLDGSYRKVRVVIESAERLAVHTRTGYVAAPASAERQNPGVRQ
jgi:VWFA-related protein